jgi:PKD repeat protein
LIYCLTIITLLFFLAMPVEGAGKPSAAFSADITSGPVPLAVQFTDSSTAATGWTWYFGDESYDGAWTNMTASPGWAAREWHSMVAIPSNGGRLVLMGGSDQDGTDLNDTWYSLDKGTTWVQGSSGAQWSAREQFSSVVLPDDSIVLTGGYADDYLNDSWRSLDYGMSWVPVPKLGVGWSGRIDHRSVAMPDGTIILTGGYAKSGPTGRDMINKNDTWLLYYNTASWIEVNSSSGWNDRAGHCMVVLPDSSIVLMGGNDYENGGFHVNRIFSDTWRSTDNGYHWTLMNASGGWTPREGHTCVAMPDGSILLMGGRAYPDFLHDVWRSADKGATWTEVQTNPGWTAREFPVAAALPDGSVVIAGGYDDSAGSRNDTWRLQTAGSNLRNPMHTYGSPGTYTVALQANNSVGTDLELKPDYITASSSRDKIGVFRPSTHLFYEDYNGNGAWNGAVTDRSYNFGITGDIPITGDWNHDGTTDIGVFRPSTHLFYLDYNGNGVWNGAVTDRSRNFGITGDIPINGDWNNDGTTDIGVFRPSTHLFYLDYNGNGVWNGAVTDRSRNFGITGDIPITGDWNTDGTTDIGVFRPSTHLFYLDYNGNGVWNGAVTDRSYNFGITGDIPISGDWNTDGTTDIGVFRPATHLFYLDFNGNGVWNGGSVDRLYNFGITGDTPVSGTWS